jgi:hypothetical protein
MNYVRQEEPTGCLIAAVAMCLDMTYAEVNKFIPLNTPADMQGGQNLLAPEIIDGLKKLLASKGMKMCEPLDGPPYNEIGTRYLATILTGEAHLNHALAVDENGIAFDPADESFREPFASSPDERISSVVGFRPISPD